MYIRLRYTLVWLCSVLLMGCSLRANHNVGEHPTDILNRKARVWQYRDLDSTAHYARKAYDEAGHYIHGRSVACNMLGFVAFMRMDYDGALYWYDQVEQQSGCELERLVADIGRMNTYQRVADNLAFYDCRVRAMKRLAHINEESATFSAAEQHRLRSAVNDLHMVSALHHYMIGQRPEAYAEMRLVTDDEALRADSAQWLIYTYIKGLGLDVEGDTREQRQLRRYTYLNNCLRTSRAKGYRYFEGLASSGLSELLSDSVRMVYIAQQRPGSFSQLVGSPSASLGVSFAQDALQCLTDYGDEYGVLNASIQMASLYNRIGEYDAALAILDTLDAAPIPDAQARQHEEMSVAYAGLGNKAASDDHRNQYLDLLETTRQDKEVESRYLSLQRRSRTAKLLLYVVVAGVVLFVFLLTFLAKRQSRKGYESRLRELLQETEKRVFLHQRAIDKGKRDNIVRKASFSMVTDMLPYINRMVHEIEQLQTDEVWDDKSQRTRRLEYISELADEINILNELLSRWVKTTQGMVRLAIEPFFLAEVFDMIERSASAYAMKGITLEVSPTDAVVKADKALTFFMLNTLADNARKFTPEGGRVMLSATVCDEYVELSVTDTGIGMSSEDIARILHEKVYDAATIGQGLSSDWRGRKGSGFGLLNCKGIIEKYRKTDPLFEVCSFGIDSRVGEGSRFWFRLPKGVRRMLLLVVGFLPLIVGSPLMAQSLQSAVIDSENIQPLELSIASAYADSVYYANVDGRYGDALIFADSALRYLNAHHRQYAAEYIDTLSVAGGEIDVETRWWLSDYATDYHTILDVRNELAVAYLAQRRLAEYRYNNRIYNDLYKLVSEDRSLIDYCNRMQRYYSNTSVAVLICLLLVVGYLVIIAYAYMGRVASAYRNIESMEDDERRARHEESRLHVQNMVLDNSLSALKHETIYYPNRIKQLVGRLDSVDDRRQMHELVAYYRVAFSTLAGCASRQLEEVTFRRTAVKVDALLGRAVSYHAKRYGRNPEVLSLAIASCGATVLCDEALVDFLMEQLVDASLSLSSTDTLYLAAELDGDFVRFSLTNRSRTFDADTLHRLFSPSRVVEGGEHLQGTEYLVCRQIIREHDTHFNHVGCRIKAEAADGGYVVWFTLPLSRG